ncbi:MAG: hypothetical protein ACJAU6_001663 [Alphaproteobacteria bacterium]|jgi:hypothetical protein
MFCKMRQSNGSAFYARPVFQAHGLAIGFAPAANGPIDGETVRRQRAEINLITNTRRIKARPVLTSGFAP